MLIPFISGGIGDMLQALPEALSVGKVAIQSHAQNAKDVFLPFNIQVLDLENDKIRWEGLKPASRDKYLDVLTPQNSVDLVQAHLETTKPIVGIHPIGSKFHNQIWYARGGPLKYIPLEIMEEIVKDDKFFYLIFGTEAELEEYSPLFNDNVIPVCCPNIWDSFAHVDVCDKIIAVDSAIKSYSVMRRKKTLVFVPETEDEFRDVNFITPYVIDGYMRISLYKELGEKNLADVRDYLGS